MYEKVTTRLNQDAETKPNETKPRQTSQDRQAKTDKPRQTPEKLKRRDCFGFVIADIKDLIEFGDLEDFKNLRTDVTHLQAALGSLHFAVERDQLAQSSTRKKLNVREVE
jgi:hypothetical protein